MIMVDDDILKHLYDYDKKYQIKNPIQLSNTKDMPFKLTLHQYLLIGSKRIPGNAQSAKCLESEFFIS